MRKQNFFDHRAEKDINRAVSIRERVSVKWPWERTRTFGQREAAGGDRVYNKK